MVDAGLLAGIAGIIWWILWAFLIHESPAKHPSISKSERNYIEQNVDVQKVKDNVYLK